MIKPLLRLWIEFFSSGGQESWLLYMVQQQPFILWGILQDKVRMLGALVPCSPSEHVFCCTLLTLWCACVNEWHALHKQVWSPACNSVVTSHGLWQIPVGGLYRLSNAKRHPQLLWGTHQKWAKHVDWNLLFSQTFWSLGPFQNSLELEVLT